MLSALKKESNRTHTENGALSNRSTGSHCLNFFAVCGALRGAGDTKFVMLWMTACAFGVWLPLVWLVSEVRFTMPMLWTTTIVYVAVLFVGSFLRWRRGAWKRIRIV